MGDILEEKMSKRESINFGLYAMGKLVSLLGSSIQMIAIPLYILDLTGSGKAMGTFTMLTILPFLIMAPFAGVIGDRWNRKKIMVHMDWIRGIIILGLMVLAQQELMNIAYLFIAQVVLALMGTVFNASTGAMLPDIVDEKHLLKANSVMGGINGSSQIVGPILGGVLYGFGGIKMIFLINGVSFILSAISEIFIVYQPKNNKMTDKITPKIFIEDLKEGMKYIFQNKSLIALLIYFCGVNLLFSPAFAVILPYALKLTLKFSDYQYGIVQSTFMVGILIGNVLLGAVLSKRPIEKLIKNGITGMIFFSLTLALTFFPQIVSMLGGKGMTLMVVICLQFILMGIFNALINTSFDTNFQRLVPTEIRSRVFSVTGIVSQMGVPVGAVVFGFLLDMIPSYVAFFIAVGLGAVVTIGFYIKAPKEVFNPLKETA